MPKYRVSRDFSGYVRGQEIREVTADSEEEAISLFHSGTLISDEIVRDDTSTQGMYADEILPPKAPVKLTAAQKLLYKSLFGKYP